MTAELYHIGIDIGSTTVKVVVMDEALHLLFKKYQRHHSRARELAADMLLEAKEAVGSHPVTVAFSGSAGLSVAEMTGIPFAQEVFATKTAVDTLLSGIDAVVELGGEDAKILFLTGGTEERMNGSCAGGTGAFIDQMASLLNLSVTELDSLSFQHTQIYNIASRCGVFAKSDIQPLLNQGANKSDVAASIYQAIVNQTIAGLPQGREIKGKVAFLGGPLTFLLGLRQRFVETLKLDKDHAVFPDNAEYYVAMGAALEGKKGDVTDFDSVYKRLTETKANINQVDTLPPLFQNDEEYEEFKARHACHSVEQVNMDDYRGEAFLGVDAGSTTTKCALITPDGKLLYTYYTSNNGDPLTVIREQLKLLYERFGDRIIIKGSAVTGYGEELLKNAFHMDFGIVETVAHYYAARHFEPNVDFIMDIGGQDMKCFKLKNGVVDSILLNEACSSGCGSFIEAFAVALGYPVAEFAALGLQAKHPVNLGSRCTVFMNSSVKQAQKDGAGIDDISAGLSISVVKNAVYKVIRAHHPDELGKNIVVQGGTFLNDAILRAFELEIGRNVTRPAIAGLMGAYGAALYACHKRPEASTLIGPQELEVFVHKAVMSECKGCTNRCKLTINTFGGPEKYISGNRCDKPLGKKALNLPNAYQFKQERLASYRSKGGTRGKIGLPMGLNLYELLPFWFTIFDSLGFEVVVSGPSSRGLYVAGQHTIPSDTVCYPAKLMHGHIEQLLDQGVDTVFYPCMPYNFDEKQGDNHYNCPVVAFYPELIQANVTRLKEIRYLNPYVAPHARKAFTPRFIQWLGETFGIDKKSARAGIDNGYAELAAYQQSVYDYGEKAIAFAKENGRDVIVLAGRPYHADGEINHGMDTLLTSLGLVVISEDCIPPAPQAKVNVLNQWTYHSRLYHAARFVCEHKNMNLVQLVSFGCGLDAITTDEVKDILEQGGKIYTQIKIDEITNLGAAKIRLRSLIEATKDVR